MCKKWLAIITVFSILLSAVTPVLAAPANQGYEGRPAGSHNASSLGYYIWQDGDRWYLEVTNNGRERQFTGSIQTDGEFSHVKTLATEQKDRIRVDAERNKIGFRFRTGREKEGLSFTVFDGTALTIALYIDGQPVDPTRIHLGRQNRNPGENPFRINLRGDAGPDSRINYTGRPTMFAPGNSLGYFIWQDGERWYLEATTNGNERNFRGVIETDGTFADVRTVSTQSGDRAEQSPLEKLLDLVGQNANKDSVTMNPDNNQIDLSFRTSGDADGVSFSLRDGAFMKFTLYSDGQVIDASRIYLGRQNRNPAENPFRIAVGDVGYNPYGQGGQSGNSRYDGRPAGFDPGNELGYYIWHENGYWYLQSTTQGRNRTFSGTVKSRSDIMDVATIRAERQDGIHLSNDRNTIRFNLQTAGGEDGFRFRIRGGEPIDFELYIDGQKMDRSRIYLGRNGYHPAGHSFSLEQS